MDGRPFDPRVHGRTHKYTPQKKPRGEAGRNADDRGMGVHPPAQRGRAGMETACRPSEERIHVVAARIKRMGVLAAVGKRGHCRYGAKPVSRPLESS